MNKLLKLLFTFLLFSSIILMVSPVNNKSNLDNNIVQYNYINTSRNVSKAKIPSGRIIMEPVVKLTQISFPEPGTVNIVGTATGFSIKYNSRLNKTYILTNEHFCENKTEFDTGYVYTRSNDTSGGSAVDLDKVLSIVHSDKKRDLCVLEANDRINPIKFGDYKRDLRALDKVYVVGAPKGIFPIVLEAYFTGFIERKVLFGSTMGETGHDYLLISQIVHGGHSGSPIFNQRGELVGIIFAKAGVDTYGGFGVGLKDIIEFIGESNI